MRSIWRGSISFGLVNIPVRLYSATENRDIRFRTLHGVCGSPIRYLKYCPHCEAEVNPEDLVRGYPLDQNRFVTITDEELESLPIETARQVDIVDFVSLGEIDPIYYDKSYYLEPGEGAEKPYALLRRAMQDAGRVAMAKVALRQKESLACLRVHERVLVMETMFYPDEIRPAAQLAGLERDPELSDKERDMAERLIENLTEPFDPTRYRDEYREALETLIQAKIAGKEVAPAPGAAAAGKVIDLMAALEASLQATAGNVKGEAAVSRPIKTKRGAARQRKKEKTS